MSRPPALWTAEEVAADIAASTHYFRETRLKEPVAAWSREVDERWARFSRLFDEYAIARPDDLTPGDVPSIIEAGLLDEFRYLFGPPVSADDLKSLADVGNLSPKKLRRDPEAAEKLLTLLRNTMDARRFPWIAEGRLPSNPEKDRAIFASALMLAAQRALTERRSVAKEDQERAVRDVVTGAGLTAMALQRVRNHAQFPERGIVSLGEVQFGPERADVLVRLWDDRMMPIECKVSNSAVNSYKRLNHDTLAKHHAWRNAFGRANVVPAVVLAGVYSEANVLAAQEAGLAIFWSHRLADLTAYIEDTR